MWVKAVVRIGLACVASLLLALLVMEGLHRFLLANGLARARASVEPAAGVQMSSAGGRHGANANVPALAAP
jgi:hypothetical protein